MSSLHFRSLHVAAKYKAVLKAPHESSSAALARFINDFLDDSDDEADCAAAVPKTVVDSGACSSILVLCEEDEEDVAVGEELVDAEDDKTPCAASTPTPTPAPAPVVFAAPLPAPPAICCTFSRASFQCSVTLPEDVVDDLESRSLVDREYWALGYDLTPAGLAEGEAAIRKFDHVMCNIFLSVYGFPGIDVEDPAAFTLQEKQLLVAELWHWMPSDPLFPPRLAPLLLSLRTIKRNSCASAHFEHARVFLAKYGVSDIPCALNTPPHLTYAATLTELARLYKRFVLVGFHGTAPPDPCGLPVTPLQRFLRSNKTVAASVRNNTSAAACKAHSLAMEHMSIFQDLADSLAAHSLLSRLHTTEIPARQQSILANACIPKSARPANNTSSSSSSDPDMDIHEESESDSTSDSDAEKRPHCYRRRQRFLALLERNIPVSDDSDTECEDYMDTDMEIEIENARVTAHVPAKVRQRQRRMRVLLLKQQKARRERRRLRREKRAFSIKDSL